MLVLPLVLLIAHLLISGNWFRIAIKWYTFIFIIVFSLLAVVDLPLYYEWGYRLDTTPLIYLDNTRGAFASLKWYETFFYIITGICFIIPFLFYYNRFVSRKINNFQGNKFVQLPVILLVLVGLIIPIRGGLGTAPVSIGSAYFHKDAFVNHAALNLPWNIIYSITKLEDTKNPFLFYPEKKFDDFLKIYKSTDSSSKQLISSKRPNILIVVLESFTSKVIGVQNAEYKATPYIDSLARNGILFTNFYASGFRSDKGLVAILSGYPAQPNTSVMVFPDKTQKLPGLARTFDKLGYSTAFYYGGDINFASMGSYMLNIGFKDIVSQNNFEANEVKSSWGVPDEYLFAKLYKDIVKADTPYFKTVFTLSSHPPYDVPGKPFFTGNTAESKFINSIHYTDQQLGKFIRQLEMDGLLKNTLVILVADHGNKLTGNTEYNSKENFQIPMIWYGGVVKKTEVIQSISSQIDIPATLLNQLNISHHEYFFSRNIVSNSYMPEAFYAFRNGFGYLSDSAYYTYQKDVDQIFPVENKITPMAEYRGKLFFQALHENFIQLGH